MRRFLCFDLSFSLACLDNPRATLGAPAGLPASGLVINMSIWGACFPHLPLPAEFAYVQAVDWLIERFRTVSNVNLLQNKACF